MTFHLGPCISLFPCIPSYMTWLLAVSTILDKIQIAKQVADILQEQFLPLKEPYLINYFWN